MLTWTYEYICNKVNVFLCFCSKLLLLNKHFCCCLCPILLGMQPWWCHQMETFSALLAICAGNSPVTGEFPAQRPVMQSFDVFFDLCLKKRLSKQWQGWWFEDLRCHCAHYGVTVMTTQCWTVALHVPLSCGSIPDRPHFLTSFFTALRPHLSCHPSPSGARKFLWQKILLNGSGQETAAVLLPGFAIDW